MGHIMGRGWEVWAETDRSPTTARPRAQPGWIYCVPESCSQPKLAGIFVQANCSGGLEYWRPRERHKADRNRGGDNGGMKTRDSPAMCARQGQSHPGVEADEAHLLLVANSFIRCLEGVRRSSASDRAGAVRLSHQRLPANAQSASKRHLVCFPKASKLGPETRQLVVNTDEYSSLLCSSLVCQGAWNENRRIHHP
jgi:hypothetical protein